MLRYIKVLNAQSHSNAVIVVIGEYEARQIEQHIKPGTKWLRKKEEPYCERKSKIYNAPSSIMVIF
jgi:hypothetical protein